MLDRWFGGDEPVDHYELRYLPPSGGSWRRATHADLAEDVGELSNKLEESHIRQTAETENWKPGTYALQGRRTDGTLTDFLWRFELEGEVDDGAAKDEQLRRLERKIDRLENGDSESVDPEKELKRMKVVMTKAAVQNEEFLARFGPVVAADALGVNNHRGIDLEEIDEHGPMALAVDAYNNPEKLKIGSKQIGEALSAALDGFEADGDSQGVVESDESGGLDIDLDAGASSMGELVSDGEDGGDSELSRPEARYRLRFPGQYDAEQVEAAREVLTDEEVAEIEEAAESEAGEIDADEGAAAAATDGGEQQCEGYTKDGERCSRRAEPGSAYCYQHRQAQADGSDFDAESVAESLDGGAESDPEPEAETDGGVTGGTSVVINDPRLIDQIRGVLSDRSELELQEIARADNAPPTPPERVALRLLRRDDSVWGGTEYERRKVVRRVARDLLRGEPVADGGHQARQPLSGRLKLRHIVGVLIILGLLFRQGGGDGAS